MEKIIAFSVAGFTLVTSKVADLFKVVVACMILSCIASFQDFYSFFSQICRAIFFMFSLVQYALSRGNSAIADADDGVKVSLRSECCENRNNGENKESFGEDVFKVVDRLVNTSSENLAFLEEMVHLFDEREPSVEEIKETFDLFDENGDGYIDGRDLEKLLSKMGFSEFSQQDCRGMIKAFGDNKDGRIDFGEFLRLMENSFD